MVVGFPKVYKLHKKLLNLWSQMILKSYFLFLTWLLYHLHVWVIISDKEIMTIGSLAF